MNLIFKIASLLLISSTCLFAQMDDCITEETDGYNMLLIGNSFFRPYADKLDDIAIEAGFENHNSTTVFRGGENGRPINFWQDSLSAEHNQIKAALDQGDVEFFGMTAGLLPDNPTDGFKQWIEYALVNNPDVTIFLSIPPFDFPEGDPNGDRPDWHTFALENGFISIQEFYSFFIDELVHQEIVDQLRLEFPSTKIFTIPTGWATFNLNQMNIDGELLDDVDMFGPRETSIFTDDKGHQGDIVRETGGMIWLNSIYNVELSSFDYDTGFNTDLNSIAAEIVNGHNSDYRLCFELLDTPEINCDSTYAVILEEGIIYGEGLTHDGNSPSTEAIPLLLDVYYPDNDIDNRPLYFFIHGGGFSGGSRQQEAIVDKAHYFASRGWVFVSIDYRLRGDLGSIFIGVVPDEWLAAAMNIPDPSQAGQFLAMYLAQRDAKAALRWTVANATDYNINTNFISVGGGSAGATTAITLGISNQEDFRDEISIDDDPTLATTNLDQTYAVQNIIDFWGSNRALEVYELIYGHHRFDSLDPELFIAHGTEDPTVLYEEAEILVQAYDSIGVYVDLNTLQGAGHGAWNAIVDGKSLSDLSFDFLVERQALKLNEDCETTNTAEETSIVTVSVFPNPTSRFINIKVDGPDYYKASLYDIDGRLLDSGINANQFSTASLHTGIYLIEIRDTKSGKVIIERIMVSK